MSNIYNSIIVDSHNLGIRSWWPLKQLKTSSGIHTGLEFGFLKNFLSLVREYYPIPIKLAWDGNSLRAKIIYADYKCNRKRVHSEEELPWKPRFNELRKVMANVVECFYHENTEADEQIARYVYQQETLNNKTLIWSNDQDLLQLVSENTFLFNGTEILTPSLVISNYGVPPQKIPLLKAISGDNSDNLNGILRIPTTLKIRLINASIDLEHMISLLDTFEMSPLNRKKLQDGVMILRRNHEIVNLLNQKELPDSTNPLFVLDIAPLLDFCNRLELKSILGRKELRLLDPTYQNEVVQKMNNSLLNLLTMDDLEGVLK